MNARPGYVLRPMRHEDIAQVVSIDRLSFPMPWSYNTYRYEISHNPSSTMVTLSLDSPGEAATPPSRNGLPGLVNRLLGRQMPGRDSIVVGYGGFWFRQRQAHISTIAVHPDYRGRGLGELLLAGMIRRALDMDALIISLEVRVSNAPAIALYRKYEFAQFGLKRHYYRDNGEDAYDLRIAPADQAYRARLEKRWAALSPRIRFTDQFTQVVSSGTNIRF